MCYDAQPAWMGSRLGWFVKGLKCSSKFRESIKLISSEDEAIDILKTYMRFLGYEKHHKKA